MFQHHIMIAIGGILSIAIYAGMCVVIYKKHYPLISYSVPMGLILAMSFAINMLYFHQNGGVSVYDGLGRDGSFYLAYVNDVMHGNFFGDYYDKVIPTHYPPLYFWMVGVLAKVFSINGIFAWNLSICLVLFILPLAFFLVGRFFDGERMGFFLMIAFFALGNASVSYIYESSEKVFSSTSFTVYKPYEIIGALLGIFWMGGVIRYITSQRKGPMPYVSCGLIGGAVALMYYPWFVMCTVTAAAALIVDMIKRHLNKVDVVKSMSIIVFISLAVSSPFWFPYVRMLVSAGSEPNHGWHYVNLICFDLSRVTLGMGYCGSIFILGLYGCIVMLRSRPEIVSIVMLAVLAFIWFISGFITYPLFHITLLTQKAYTLLLMSLVFGSAYALAHVQGKLDANKIYAKPVFIMLIVIPLLSTPLTWNYRTDIALQNASDGTPTGVSEVINGIGGKESNITIVSEPGYGFVIGALSQVRMYLSPSIYYSNPLVPRTQRIKRIKDMQQIGSPEDMQKMFGDLGIQAIILRKDTRGNIYLLWESSDIRPSLFEGWLPYETAYLNRDAFDKSCFTMIFEDQTIVAYKVK